MKYKIGNKVIALLCGEELTGTVCADKLFGFKDTYGICFDEKIDSGHSCGGTCENGHGYYVFGDRLRSNELQISFDFDED